MVLLQRGGQLDAIADGDVGDEPALADHHPGDLVEGVGSGPASRLLGVGLHAGEAVGVDGRTSLGEHLGLPLPQQPPLTVIAGAAMVIARSRHWWTTRRTA